MKKKIVSVVLGLVTALVIGNSQAVVASVHAKEVPELNLTNEELFEAYAIETLGLNKDEVSADRLDYAGNHLTGLTKKLYDILKPELKKVADGERENAIVHLSFSDLGTDIKTKYTKEELGVSAIGSGDDMTEEAKQAMMHKIQEQIDMQTITDSLLWDCPYELYWYMKTVGSNYEGEYGFSYTDEYAEITPSSTIDFRFTVDANFRSDEIDKSDDNYVYSVNKSKTGAAKTAADTAKSIVNDAKNLSDYEKLAAYRNKICELTSYNYTAAGQGPTSFGTIAPWQLIYVFDNDPNTTVVCEGYAKAFAYLCELTDFNDDDIKVYTVSGHMVEDPNAKGAHMWNVVHMNDGFNYLTDITNCDENTIGAPDKLFLRGADQSVVDSNKEVIGYVMEIEGQNLQYYLYDDETFAGYAWSELEINNVDYDPSGIVIKRPSILSIACDSVTLNSVEGYEYSIDNATWQTSNVFSGLVDGTYTFYQRIAASGDTPASASQSLAYTFEAAQHKYEDDFTIDKEPTCTEDGSKSIHCSVCGASKDVTPLPALGHDWNEGEFVKKPTYTEKGAKIYKCKNDTSHTYTRVIPTLETLGDVIDEDIESFTDEELKGNEIKIIGVSDVQYTGSAITFDVRVYKGNKLLREGKEYTVKYTNNKSACGDIQSVSAPAVIITGKGTYAGIKETAKFKINPINLENNTKVCVSNDAGILGNIDSPVPVVTYAGKKLKADTDYVVIDRNTYSKAGEYEIKITGAGNYAGTVASKYTVVDGSTGCIPISKAKVSGYSKNLSYNPSGATEQNVSRLVVKVGSDILTPSDYTVSYINNTGVGTASMIIKAAEGSKKFAGEKIVTFKILGTPISKAKASFDKNQTYTGKSIKPVVTLALSDGTGLTEGRDYTISYAKNVNVGTASIIITGKGAYTGTSKKTFKIKPVSLANNPQIKISANSITIKQEDGYTTYDVIVKNNDKPLVKDVDYTVKYKKTKDSAVLTAIIKGKWNFTKTVNFNGPLN